jgi:hypothetical protein
MELLYFPDCSAIFPKQEFKDVFDPQSDAAIFEMVITSG